MSCAGRGVRGGRFCAALIRYGMHRGRLPFKNTTNKKKIQNIKISGINKIKAALNQPDFETKIPRLYDAVTALEIIEHIENPWKLIRDVAAVLKPGGILVLSTPNIASFPSRLRFFLRGTFIAFERGDLKHGHISAMPYFQMEYMF